MNFLKENLFPVIMAAVVIVGVSAGLLLGKSWGGQADTESKPYISTAGKINSLASNGVNWEGVETAKQRDDKMQHQKVTVADTFLQRNRRGYEVLSFNISGQTVPAFPVTEFKDRETLQQLFPKKYRLKVMGLLETLKPTVPPTEEEIANEKAKITASAMPVERKEITRPTGRVPMDEREYERRERFGSRETRRSGERRTGPVDATNAIERQALINLVVGKSKEGWIYADKEQERNGDRRGKVVDGAMHMAIARGKPDYSDADLWMAQVGLWVQKDIVKAINLTNEKTQETASGKKHEGVAASAVKRLMSIDVRGFVISEAGTAGATTANLQYLNLDSAKGGKTVPQLTGRACNKLYDVVHYDFTVVIPMPHLLRLQKNLMAQNYHTILEVSVIKPVQSDLYYYGTDSVMKVTIVGEMLLLTNWTRGRWDKQAKDWDKDYPPLMPVEKFLKNIKDANPDAIRDEDNRRKGMSTTSSDTKTKGGR